MINYARFKNLHFVEMRTHGNNPGGGGAGLKQGNKQAGVIIHEIHVVWVWTF